MVNRQNKTFNNVPLSVLDLVPVLEGSYPKQSFQNSVDLAQHTDKWGFHRYWLAEHHNMPGIASSATSVIIGHIAGATKHIRVGSGGIMLPNHATLVIAEQFGTLESLYPGRIDLGLGRAPGSDQATAYALRRTLGNNVEDFPMQVEELQAYFSDDPINRVQAVPGNGLDIPIWLLGSSDFSAGLAAKKGLPFSFASHFSPQHTVTALNLYRAKFQPSDTLHNPYAMIGVNVVAADTNEKAQYLATSQEQQFLYQIRDQSKKLQPPVKNMEGIWSERERIGVQQIIGGPATIFGDPQTVKEGLENLLAETMADEVIINTQVFNHKDRLRSFEILSGLMD